MILSKKVRLLPADDQVKQLYKSAGTARYIYNFTLDKQEENYKNGGSFISDRDLRKQLTVLKQKELNWLFEVSNNITKQAVKDACLAYKRYFNNQASKPRFKSRRKTRPSFYNDPVKFKVKDNYVLIEKVGWVKVSECIPKTKYTNPRITYDGKYWYISVGIDVEEKNNQLTDVCLGIDLGLKQLAVCSNGDIYENINKKPSVRKKEKKLKRLQKKVSNKYEKNKKGEEFAKTNNIIKLEKRIKHGYRQLKNIRNNHLHQTTTSIVKTKPYKIVIEDLNVSGMMKNKHLSSSIAKQGFYEFRKQLEYKCLLNGIELVIADRFYPSSKTCSKCNLVKFDLKLNDRTFKCCCGLIIDRDLNASINLSNYVA